MNHDTSTQDWWNQRFKCFFLADNTWNSWEDSIPPLLMILHLQLDSIIILIPEGRWFPRRWFCKGFCQGGESERRRRKHHQRPADGDCSHCLRVICVFWKKRYTNIRQACVNKTNWLLTDAQRMWLSRYIFLISDQRNSGTSWTSHKWITPILVDEMNVILQIGQFSTDYQLSWIMVLILGRKRRKSIRIDNRWP